MERSTNDPDRRREAAIAESRRGLYVGSGLCLGSALGFVAASTAGSTVAMVLFGAAVPILACQIGLEYRLVGRLRRQRTADEAFVGRARRAPAESRINRLKAIVNELRVLR